MCKRTIFYFDDPLCTIPLSSEDLKISFFDPDFDPDFNPDFNKDREDRARHGLTTLNGPQRYNYV